MNQLKIHTGKAGGALKVVVYGPEGIGKSTLAAHFPRPVFIDTEGSTRHMDVSRTDKPSSWTMLMEQVQYVRSDPGVCSTLVIDTADWAEQLCIASICADKKLSGIEDMGYGKGYVYLAEEFGRLLNLLEEIVGRGVHVVLTAHAMMRKFEQPDEMGAYDRWELKLQKKTSALVKEWSDLLLFANYKTLSVAADDKGKKFKAQGGRRVVYTSHHPCWDAKNRLGLPEELPLDFSALAQYIGPGAAPSAPPPPAPSAPPSPPPAQASTPAPDPAPAPPPPPPAPDPAPQEDAKHQDNADALKALRDLMKVNGVEDYQVQAAFAARGYFPEQTPLENLPADFIQGVLVGAWAQVCNWIKANDPLPF
jgi:hypothetical protein